MARTLINADEALATQVKIEELLGRVVDSCNADSAYLEDSALALNLARITKYSVFYKGLQTSAAELNSAGEEMRQHLNAYIEEAEAIDSTTLKFEE